MDDWTLTVRFNGTRPTYGVALFLAKGKSAYTYDETGSHLVEARMQVGDEGHARAYARAIGRESPDEVTVNFTPTRPPTDDPDAEEVAP